MLYVIAIILFFILVIVFYNFVIKKKEKETDEYKIKETDKNTIEIKEKYMFQIELKVLGLLNEMEPSKYIALPKVCLGNLLQPKGSKLVYNSLATKTVDFVVFDRSSMKPVMVVDIYDNTFNDEALSEQDPNITALFKDINLPFISLMVKGSIDSVAFKKSVMDILEPPKPEQDKEGEQSQKK